MKVFYCVTKYLGGAVFLGILPALLSVLLQGGGSGIAMAADDGKVEKTFGEGLYFVSPTDAVDSQNELRAAKAGKGGGALVAMNQPALVDNGVDADEDIAVVRAGDVASGEPKKLVVAKAGPSTSSRGISPPTPPPDKVVSLGKNNTLLAATSTPKDLPQNQPAPGPKTSKESSVSTPLLAGAGVAIAVGAAAAAGGGSSSDDSSPTGTPTTSGDTSTGATDVIRLSDLVRIGDDNDYNGNHPDKFKQNRPSGLSWTDSFTINTLNGVSSVRFKYTVAGSKVANPIYLNGQQVGRLCNPGNTAWNVEDCSTNITGSVHTGSNEIKIRCGIDQSDTSTPYDDVELYNLRIELAH